MTSPVSGLGPGTSHVMFVGEGVGHPTLGKKVQCILTQFRQNSILVWFGQSSYVISQNA